MSGWMLCWITWNSEHQAFNSSSSSSRSTNSLSGKLFREQLVPVQAEGADALLQLAAGALQTAQLQQLDRGGSALLDGNLPGRLISSGSSSSNNRKRSFWTRMYMARRKTGALALATWQVAVTASMGCMALLGLQERTVQ